MVRRVSTGTHHQNRGATVSEMRVYCLETRRRTTTRRALPSIGRESWWGCGLHLPYQCVDTSIGIPLCWAHVRAIWSYERLRVRLRVRVRGKVCHLRLLWLLAACQSALSLWKRGSGSSLPVTISVNTASKHTLGCKATRHTYSQSGI